MAPVPPPPLGYVTGRLRLGLPVWLFAYYYTALSKLHHNFLARPVRMRGDLSESLTFCWRRAPVHD